MEKEAKNRYHAIADARVDVQKVLADPAGVVVQPVIEVVQAPQSRLRWIALIVLVAAVTGLAAWSLKPVPLPESGSVTRFPFLLPEGQQFSRPELSMVALSPDGMRMAYVANGQLHLRDFNQTDSLPVPGTDEPDGGPATPVFSPDGEWLAYIHVLSPTESLLKRVPVSGGTPVTVFESGFQIGLSWPTPETMVFAHQDGILRIPANGGAPEVLVTRGEDEMFDSPQILPGGEQVLFTRTLEDPANAVGAFGDAAQIVVQSISGSERTLVWDGGGAARYLPTGHIVYAQGNTLFASVFDLDTLTIAGGAVPLVEGTRRSTNLGSDTAQYAVSEAGTLAYLPGDTGSGGVALALVNRDGTQEILDVPLQDYVGPRLSPDGTRLAVEARSEGGSAIFVYDLSGSTAMRRLTQTSEGSNGFPLWTPDSERVTFTSDRDGVQGIYWQSADGTDVAEALFLAEEDTYLLPTGWSPDGRTLIFTQGRTPLFVQDGGIWTLSLDGGAEAEPTLFYDDPDTAQLGATFSPDGNWIAYRSDEAGAAGDVYVQPFPPTGRTYRVTEASVNIFGPLWSADGTELFYQLMNGITAVDVATTEGFQNGPERSLAIQGFLASRPYRDYDVTISSPKTSAQIRRGPVRADRIRGIESRSRMACSRYRVSVESGQFSLAGVGRLTETGTSIARAQSHDRVNIVQHIHPAEQDRQPPVPGQDPEQNAPPGAHELTAQDDVQEGFERAARFASA